MKISFFQFKKIVACVSVLSGTIIGVGIFSLPYITSKVGIYIMLLYFIFLGWAVILIHQYFGELVLITPDFKRLPGFAKQYLGKWGERIAYLSTIFGIYGSLLAYLIVGGEFLKELLSPYWAGADVLYTFVYFLAGSFLIAIGIKFIAGIELIGLILFFLILFFIFLKSLPFLKISDFLSPLDSHYLFLPYGPVLFSLWGASLIPETEEMLTKDKKLLKKVILLSLLIPIFVYLFFIFLVLGISGPFTTPFALTGLRNFLGDGIYPLLLVFGILTAFTSFITLGLTLKKMFLFDLGINKRDAFFITICIPLILFLLGFQSFIDVISFVGGVLLGVEGILILLMYRKAKKKNFVTLLLLGVLGLGIIYELFSFLI